jgi:hypothetical protein
MYIHCVEFCCFVLLLMWYPVLPKISVSSLQYEYTHSPAMMIKEQTDHVIFLFNKTNTRTTFPDLFLSRNSTCSDSSSARHQEFSTVHSALVYVIQVWWQLSSMTWSCLIAVIKPAWHIPVLNVQWKTPDDVQRNCPKHVKFLDKNKFGKLVHLLVLLKINLLRCTVTWTKRKITWYMVYGEAWSYSKDISKEWKNFTAVISHHPIICSFYKDERYMAHSTSDVVPP